jgi:shikimate dehydrogenase
MTAIYAEVIGDPISHSKSPIIHNFWLGKLGIEAEYRACHVKQEGLAAYLDQRRSDPNWRGCNVTLPHKIAVMDHVGDPGEVRTSIGAMNTIVRQGEGLIGTNTDAGGFFMPIMDEDWESARAIVVGTGGAAHAILFALAKAGTGPVTLLARNALKGAALLSRYGLRGEVKSLDSRLPPAQLLVNATSLGMKGQDQLILDLTPLPADAIVYDIVYAPLETDLLKDADARGLRTVDGLSMLIGQAALAFELFFDAPVPEGHDEELRELLLT